MMTPFEKRIAAAIANGRRKIGHPISTQEAVERAKQVALALPQLNEPSGA